MGMKLLIGCVLGFLSGLGLGGGSLLMLWLTAVEAVGPQAARNINLLFFLPCGIISLLFRIKNGEIHKKSALIAGLAGCATAVAANLLIPDIGGEWLKKLLGLLFITTGAKELLTKK